MKRLALKRGRWEDRRAAIEARLVGENDHQFLTEVHLLEHEMDDALRCLQQAIQPARQPDGWRYLPSEGLILRVARAIEESHTDEAVRLYMHVAGDKIGRRGRGNYREAARHLTAVRDLYRRLGREADWQRLIAEVRDRYRNLAALKDEMAKAGL